MTDRKPDYVFNVWESGRAQRAYETAHHSAASWLAYNNSSVPPRVTHRIRVFMKDKRQNDYRALTEGQLLP